MVCPLLKKIMEANSSSLIIPEEADFADEEQRLLTIVLGQYLTTYVTSFPLMLDCSNILIGLEA